ncbi:GNAT family N-acetyltransferase [Herbaspirillum sp. B65]|uniref:GNAT family N-acetyltransferase n=1 Tax=Herbaspirillum sp. B65 TaxID=137708 RepID=UPI00034525ED|nr:GNAT family N-acetyltransferase [Herbaspirillum sp. B65]
MMEILAFAPQHAQGVVDLILPIQQQEFDIPITLEGQPDLKDIAGFYQKGLGNFWVALDAGKVVGSISLLDIGNQQVALRKMFVAASHRGKEHGTAVRLLEGALAWAREQGVHQVFLGTTAKFLAAHRFYEKNGFRLIEKSDLPAAFPVMVVDTRFYALDC